ncbi:glycosyltransferase [uncultured Psychrobacter sp.]|uniref:glycosyltransferase n=1 Tax=uncultured Psychrobacter sp. TaxID=259303 RepID=UPI002619953C|nr:glycosyltransferase [uncultured Psychrobacter sp.]
MTIQKILHIVGRMDRAGAETMLMNLYRNIDHSQIQFDFVTFTDQEADYDAEIIELGGRIIPILANNPIERMLKLQRFLKNNPEYKIVHAHMLLSNAFHLLAAKGAGIKHRISHSHNTSSRQYSKIGKLYKKWALIINRQIATDKIACGKLAAQYLFGTTKDVLILPNAVDVDTMITKAGHSRDYLSKTFKDDGLKIIQVGRLSEVKNHQFSLQVAEELKKRNVDFTMYFVGQGPLEESLRAAVDNKKLTDQVKFLGVRSDITEIMAGSDYMIMPSLHEGFPVVLVESQATGLNALVSDQVSKEVDLGLELVKFLSLNSVENWVEHLISSKEHRYHNETHIAKSLKSQGFDAATNAQKLSQVYKSL